MLVHRNNYFEVPSHVSPFFTGREQVGRRLEVAFSPSKYRGSNQRRFVLFGMGGAGKTQICLHYVNTHRDWYNDTSPLFLLLQTS
jgi:Holliday junction resolvasome RuvABC ATP-dependent DNA helicase subunit